MPGLRHYRKQLLRPGTFIDESGRRVYFDEETVRRAAEELNRAVADGVRIPVVLSIGKHPTELHESTPDIEKDSRYAGRLDLAALQGGWLLGDIDAGDRSLPEGADVSVWIEPRVKVGDKEYGPFIRHVLLTDEPAVKGQGAMILLRAAEPSGSGGASSSHTPPSAFRSPHSILVSPAMLESKPDPTWFNEDGTFKGGFDGCVEYMMSHEGHDKESATKICGYIAQQKAGLRTCKKEIAMAEKTLAEQVRLRLGVAAEAKDEDVLAALDAKLKAPAEKKPEEKKEPDLPETVKLRLAEAESKIRNMERDAFEHELAKLTTCEGRITPAVRDKLKAAFAPNYGARLRAGEGKDEQPLHEWLLGVLRDLPEHHAIDDKTAKLRIVPGLADGGALTKEKAKDEADKTLATVGIKAS